MEFRLFPSDVATNGASAQSPVSATQVSVFDVARFDALQQQVAAPYGVNTFHIQCSRHNLSPRSCQRTGELQFQECITVT